MSDGVNNQEKVLFDKFLRITKHYILKVFKNSISL